MSLSREGVEDDVKERYVEGKEGGGEESVGAGIKRRLHRSKRGVNGAECGVLSA